KFDGLVYAPHEYIPALALCYQISKVNDPARSQKCGAAAKAMAMKMASDYNSGVLSFARDSGYDIRFGLMELMIVFDWVYDQLSRSAKALLLPLAPLWVDWYHDPPGYSARQALEIYYAGYLQGLTLTAMDPAGDNSQTDRLLGLLRTKLTPEVPIINQRACGG